MYTWPSIICPWAAVLLVSGVVLPNHTHAQSSPEGTGGVVTSWSPAGAMARMAELGIAREEGPVPLYVSAGFGERGRELAGLLAESMAFYERELHVRPLIELAVLDEPDWVRVTPVPYGLPHPFMGDPSVVFLGATSDHDAAADMRARHIHASSEDRDRILGTGLSWNEASARVLDLVGFHELGHIYARVLGIETHTHWFSEMLATYIGYAFMREQQPGLATIWDSVLAATITSPRPAYTSLADFERLYVNVGISNYGWYQGAFQVRAREVYDARGIDFVHRVHEALPAQAGERLSTHDLLARLERIEPGFYAWAERLGLYANE